MSIHDANGNLHASDTGRYQEKAGTRPAGSLTANLTPSLAPAFASLQKRRQALRDHGYLSAGASLASVDPRTTEGISQWWETHYVNAELRGAGAAAFPLMPDDNTPAMTGGKALSEHRRTHRMLYEGPETALRMPSATAFRRFSAQSKSTFDAPVEATYPVGKSFSGYVRTTDNGDGTWSVSALTDDPEAAAYVAESVQAVLENRHPSRALPQIASVLERRRHRLSAAGAVLKPLEHSSFVSGVGYNRVSGQMVIQLQSRVYGYTVAPEVFEQVRDATSTGKAYNHLVKGQSASFAVDQCSKCARFYRVSTGHRCASKHRDPIAQESRYNQAVRVHVTGR